MTGVLTLEVADFMDGMRRLEEGALKGAEKGLNDCVDDLIRISSNIAPIEYGSLRASHKKKLKVSATGVTAEVSFSIRGRGGYNYAVAMHEWSYTPKQGGGYMGYSVGRKYLERPLKMETPKYNQWIGKAVREGIGG
ncbi:hypothetical protein [Bacillus sp. SN10]|uniref:hypothetical protein n=1 Tax=Bacillus sp. SN10 TaxID=2056493 RepID=UPI000C348409|nr:hypothetical protein [Bacillus sp. SN10]PKJ52704.1 hypothetical protein CWE34_26655 [Bacillus sp. SN10]